MRYFIKTFGCQMNISDSERIAGFLEAREVSPAENIEDANLIIFNTCGVRQMAEDRVYGQVHNLHEKNPRLKIIVTGCLADRKDVQRRLKNKVDLFFPIVEFEKFENWIIENLKLKAATPKRTRSTQEKISYLSVAPKYANNYQAFVPIMTGCNNFCSYCVVPYARGREVSRPAKEIVAEVESLVKNGCVSITLLGQNVNSYTDGSTNFSKLLKKINSIPGKFWIHFVSSHPKDMTPKLIETIAKCKKVCELVHLPIQAGSDEIIAKMNRKYTAKHYLSLVRKIKSAFKKHKPDTLFAITSDIIVGFPGETRKLFLESATIMEKVRYDMVYFGQFSPRPGTAAWLMKDNVTKTEKARREKYLNEILARTALTNNNKYVGKKVEVLVEKEKDGSYFGKTRTLKNVLIRSSKKNLSGKIMKAKITKATAWNLEGEIK